MCARFEATYLYFTNSKSRRSLVIFLQFYIGQNLLNQNLNYLVIISLNHRVVKGVILNVICDIVYIELPVKRNVLPIPPLLDNQTKFRHSRQFNYKHSWTTEPYNPSDHMKGQWPMVRRSSWNFFWRHSETVVVVLWQRTDFRHISSLREAAFNEQV